QAGPVAIFGGGTFVGGGVLDKLRSGETAVIPYRLDSGTSGSVEGAPPQNPARGVAVAEGGRAVGGVGVVSTTYPATVGAQAPARLFLRHPRREGFTADRLPPATEATADAYLAPISITPKRPGELSIEERRTVRADLPIVSMDPAKLAA